MNISKIPQHIAIIMDGNGRWAKKRLLPRFSGHKHGVETAKLVVKLANKYKIPHLTLFAFSSENWQRPKYEINILMKLLSNLLTKQIQELHENNVKLKIIGNMTELSYDIQQQVVAAEKITAKNDGLNLNVAINYGGKWDIVNACKNISQNVVEQKISVLDINEEMFHQELSLSKLPDVDLLIRTSGEMRISNFLLWQIAYSEIFFTNTLWPDFNENDFVEAINFFVNSERRFGSIEENDIKSEDNLQIC